MRDVRHLAAVPDANGEIPKTLAELKAELARKDAEIRGLTRDLRGWMVRYRQLEEDKNAEAREHPLFPLGKHLFDGWRRCCNHPKAKWTEDRFWLLEPFIALPRYGDTLEARVILCCRAIKGAQHDAWSTTRKNGTVRRFDEWDRVYGSAGQFEEFVNKAPRGWAPVLSPSLQSLIAVCAVKLEAKS
jgi:hypothetical protein